MDVSCGIFLISWKDLIRPIGAVTLFSYISGIVGNNQLCRTIIEGKKCVTAMKDKKRRWWSTVCALCLCLVNVSAVPVWASDKAVDPVYLGAPDYVYWETDTVGRWSSVSKAKEYQVMLYIADNVEREEDNWRTIDWENSELEAVMSKRTTELSFDFSEYMEDLHSYFFVVRATPKLNEQAYMTSGDWIASPDVDFKGRQVLGITNGKWRNYMEGSMYEDGDGNLLGGGWHLIRGTWYLLDANGYRQTGWQEQDGARYYLSEDGKMATGWFLWADSWYYADPGGKIQTGWVKMKPGEYYYFYGDGRMAHDVTMDGYWIDGAGKSQYTGIK